MLRDRMMRRLVAVATTLLIVATGCASENATATDSTSGIEAHGTVVAGDASPIAQGGEAQPDDLELPPQAATQAQVATAGAFLKKQDLPDKRTASKSVEISRLAGLCTESFGFELADREVALESGLMAFNVGYDPEVIAEFRTVYDACEQALVSEGAGFPKTAATTESETKALYYLRAEEYECLAANDLATKKPPPLAQYINNPYIGSPWQDLTGAVGSTPYPDDRYREAFPDYFAALEICPRLVLD